MDWRQHVSRRKREGLPLSLEHELVRGDLGVLPDAFGIARNGWAVGQNNWGNNYPQPEYRYRRPIFIFDWSLSISNSCAAGGNCGWDQLKVFASYGDSNPAKGVATAIALGAKWAAGYMTCDPNDLSRYHAFKWQVPTNPQPALIPGANWARPIDLGTLAGDEQSFAYCVSDHATTPVVGGKSYLSTRGEKAVYWDGSGIHDLYAVLQSQGVDMTRWTSLARVLGVSANGQILCGFGYYDDNNPGTSAIQMGFVANLSTTSQPPNIIQQPLAQNICQGGTVQFLVDASGDAPLTYQWQKNQVNLDDVGHYSGATAATLTITGADTGDAGNYRCVVTNPYGTVPSNEAALVVATAVPTTPTDGIPVALGTTSIRWLWTDGASETGYRVKDNGGINLSGDLAANTTQWDETSGILPNTQYTRRIYAFNASGESSPSAGQSRYSLIQTPTGVTFGTVTTASIAASPGGTLSNLAAASSGVRVFNFTAATDSGWVQSAGAWVSAGLTANAYYAFVARARNAEGVETADSPSAGKWTLSTPPGAGSVTASNKAPAVGETVVWTAVGGFGAGTVQAYRYAWNQNATHTWTGLEPEWSADTLPTTPTAAGTWYLHVQGYNGEGVANGAYAYAVSAHAGIAADLDGDADVDLVDFGLFQTCFNGPNRTAGPACSADADFDNDGDVDLNDFGTFQACFNGPNRPPKCP